MKFNLPTLPTNLGQQGGAGEKHKYSVERLVEKDSLVVRRDNGPSYEIPMRLLAQGQTIAEIYEELSNGK
mgnify:CR=1 FL=1|tara:strand:- start:24950 stop:25159 length:210 start_codon:yes stop_codon:yes gene_type:complete